ncbi:hypothetical protein [Helicobacter bilis]|uniref:hypothetical protein n=1 Tax=Helicobacter bilis TaxID=37372 RepID=UPI0029430A24|nr:hypothetical protein [Helicobacter bilis]
MSVNAGGGCKHKCEVNADSQNMLQAKVGFMETMTYQIHAHQKQRLYFLYYDEFLKD